MTVGLEYGEGMSREQLFSSLDGIARALETLMVGGKEIQAESVRRAQGYYSAFRRAAAGYQILKEKDGRMKEIKTLLEQLAT